MKSIQSEAENFSHPCFSNEWFASLLNQEFVHSDWIHSKNIPKVNARLYVWVGHSVVFDSVRPHRRQPTRLPCPWDSPEKNPEWVAWNFSSAWKWKVTVKSLSRVRLFATHGLQPTRLLRPWDFPGKRTGVGCHCLLRTSIHYYVWNR